MPKFVIERDMPGAGSLTDAELQKMSQTSVNVLKALGPEIQWLQSYVTGDKVYCVYLAPDEATIREHAKRAGSAREPYFCGAPADRSHHRRVGAEPPLVGRQGVGYGLLDRQRPPFHPRSGAGRAVHCLPRCFEVFLQTVALGRN